MPLDEKSRGRQAAIPSLKTCVGLLGSRPLTKLCANRINQLVAASHPIFKGAPGDLQCITNAGSWLKIKSNNQIPTSNGKARSKMFENIRLNEALNFSPDVRVIGKCLSKSSPMAQALLPEHASIKILADTRRGIRNDLVVYMSRPVSFYAMAKSAKDEVAFRCRGTSRKDCCAVSKQGSSVIAKSSKARLPLAIVTWKYCSTSFHEPV